MESDQSAALVHALHQLILEAAPGTTFFAKYGGAVYTLQPKVKEGHFCGVFVRDKSVLLEFRQGHRLKDPNQMLSGPGNSRRHIPFYSADELNFEAVFSMVTQAAKQSVKKS